jgi:glycosyltransferase involved in cell wall biosynthesis
MTNDRAAVLVARARRVKELLDEVRLAQARAQLLRQRALRPDIWAGEPLVSIRIPTYNRPRLLLERSLRSALAQTYPNVEVVVVGDHASPETAEALATVRDPRLRYENLPTRAVYPKFPRFFWCVAGTAAVVRAVELCRGDWIAPLDDDDEFTPDHVEVLLREAQRLELEFVWGAMEYLRKGVAVQQPVGSAPLRAGHICHGAVLYSARLKFFQYDPLAWLLNEPGDWNLWRRMAEAGVLTGFLPRVVGRHHDEHSALPAADQQDIATRVASPEQILADLEHVGALHLLALDMPAES